LRKEAHIRLTPFKLGNPRFPARRSALKRVSEKISRQVCLLWPWKMHLMGLPLPMSG